MAREVTDYGLVSSQKHVRLNFEGKKTYGHKYCVAASIGFEEKSYPFIRKMK